MTQPSSVSPEPSALPSITCLCPTYGRFERLRDAVACFLLQDYPGEKRLLIANDAPVGIWGVDLTGDLLITAWNQSERYLTLGHKRQALLKAAQTPLVAHWDDDDLYLPWHLTMLVSRLQEAQGKTCAKPGAAWWAVGPREGFHVRGLRHNVFEGQMLFSRDRALELGGYPPKDSGQARDLLRAFGRAGEAEVWNPDDHDVSYVYRWGDGVDHVSARKAPGRDHEFGDGQPLIPAGDAMVWARARLGGQVGQFRRIAAGCEVYIDRAGWDVFTARLGAAVGFDLIEPLSHMQGAGLTW